MKMYVNPKDIAKALNFNKYPVFTLNLDEHVEDFDESFKKGSSCRLAYTSKHIKEPLYIGCSLYLNDGKFTLSAEVCCLKGHYDWTDHLKNAEKAMTPIIHPGDEVAIYCYSPKVQTGLVRIMKIPDRVNPDCVPAAKLIDVE